MNKAALPILHDTYVDLRVNRLNMPKLPVIRESMSFQSFSIDGGDLVCRDEDGEDHIVYQIHGEVANPLKLSLSRHQYEQLLDSLKYLSADQTVNSWQEEQQQPSRKASVHQQNTSDPSPSIEVYFGVPTLTVELRGDTSMAAGQHSADADSGHLVRLECQDFAVSFEKSTGEDGTTDSKCEIALRRLTMEDLQLPKDDKHRWLMASSSGSSTSG